MRTTKPTVYIAMAPGGGAATYASTVARALVSKGWSVATMTGSSRVKRLVQEQQSPFPHYIGPQGNLHYLLGRAVPYARPLLRVLRGHEAACLFARVVAATNGGGGALLDVMEGINFTTRHRRRFAVTVSLHASSVTCKDHTGATLTPEDRADSRAERAQLERAQGVRSFNRYMGDYIQRTLRLNLPQLSVFPQLVDENLFEREPAGGGSGSFTLLHVGRPDPLKGAMYLIQAIPAVAERCPQARFVFAGWSAEEPAVSQLLAELPSDVVETRVKLLGFVPHEQVLRLYDEADIVVVPSLWDNSPFVVYEAMARGCAVVASAVGGIPELVTDGDGGLLVPPGDAQELASAITYLAEDRDRLMQFRRRSRERAMELFNPSEILRKQIAYYEEAWQNYCSGAAAGP